MAAVVLIGGFGLLHAVPVLMHGPVFSQPWFRWPDRYVGGAGRPVHAGQGDGCDGAGRELAAGRVPVVGLAAARLPRRALERGGGALLAPRRQDHHVGECARERFGAKGVLEGCTKGKASSRNPR